MRYLDCSFNLIACLSGLWAAYLWFKASMVNPDLRGTESGEHDVQQDTLIFATMNANVESALLNKRAALWTGISVALIAISDILSCFKP